MVLYIMDQDKSAFRVNVNPKNEAPLNTQAFLSLILILKLAPAVKVKHANQHVTCTLCNTGTM